jgi:ribosomal protein S18 acetylase RimI-like enzyme
MCRSHAEYSVRLASNGNPTPDGIEAVVRLHKAAFLGFFLTSLGPRFLRLLYRSFLDEENGICILAENEEGLLGFAAGTTEPDSFFRSLLRRRGVSFALAAIPGLVRNPVFVARKCLAALAYRGEKPVTMSNAALLSSLAVAPYASRRGIGRLLLDAFCKEAAQKGVDAVFLSTDASGNDAVNSFYKKCGFHLVDTFERPGNRRMNRWARPLK